MNPRLICVDNSAMDRRLLSQILVEAGPGEIPWLRDTDLIFSEAPLPELAAYFAYDGVILDEQLANGQRGSDIARQLHELDPRFPILILTGQPALLPPDVRDYCDGVADKMLPDNTQFEACDLFGVTRAFMRHVAECRDARKWREHVLGALPRAAKAKDDATT